MTDLCDFRNKSFVEQISVLDEIETARRLELLPQLLELYREPLGEEGVDQAVSDTLRSLLPENEGLVRQGLASEDLRIRRMCAQVAGGHRLAGLSGELADRVNRESNAEVLLVMLSALAKLGPAQHLETFRRHLKHPDPLIAALCIESLGAGRDVSSSETMAAVVEQAESDERYHDCDLVTSKAIGALEALGTDGAIRFLVGKIHHRNPGVRRRINEALIRLGPSVIPHLEPIFDGDDVDAMILAANTIGFIGERRGGDLLVAALDRGRALHANVRCAMYEALGRIPTLKGLILLLDGLAETDEMLLMAVIAALDGQLTPPVLGKVKEHLDRGQEQASRILRVLVAAKAGNAFRMLYEEGAHADGLIAAVAANKDPETRELFRSLLEKTGTERAAADLVKLGTTALSAGHKRLLVADDSKSVLMFYATVGAQLDYEVRTAMDGREALELLQREGPFDLVVTDLNMPVMDGVELAREIRTASAYSGVPILMVTTESDDSQVELARRAGVSAFLQKPLTPQAFEDKVRELVR